MILLKYTDYKSLYNLFSKIRLNCRQQFSYKPILLSKDKRNIMKKTSFTPFLRLNFTIYAAIFLAFLLPRTVFAHEEATNIKPLPKLRQDIAKAMRDCYNMPDAEKNFGNNLDTFCYGKVADLFLNGARAYAKNIQDTDDKDTIEDVKKDQDFFEYQVSQCENFLGKSGAFSQRDTWIQACRISRAREYAGYFYTPTMEELSPKTKKSRSWIYYLNKDIKEKVGI